MKKLMFGLIAGLALSSVSFAGTTYVSSKEYKPVEPIAPVQPQCFRDTELQLDFFYSYTDFRHGSQYHDGNGGGVGVNYFFHRYFGIGLSGNVLGGRAHGVWQPSVDLILRYPLEIGNHFCIAPYVFGGGGGQFDDKKSGTLNAGAGIEYRVTPHVGLFVEGRYTWTLGRPNNNAFDQGRAGVRFAF